MKHMQSYDSYVFFGRQRYEILECATQQLASQNCRTVCPHRTLNAFPLTPTPVQMAYSTTFANQKLDLNNIAEKFTNSRLPATFP